MEFEQKKWLKPYIGLNTQLRSKIEINFQENIFKCMYNIPSGNIVEDVRKRKGTVTVRTAEECRQNQI